MIFMHTTSLDLPTRVAKPRHYGLTMMIDKGLPADYFCDVIRSSTDLVDLVKFGWGTSLVTATLERKIDCLRECHVEFSFGGTLFEKFVSQGRLVEYLDWCRSWRCPNIEVSDGTIEMSLVDKCAYVADLAAEFTVFSEVGFKDASRSEQLSGGDWVERITAELAAGASYVITEARESGTSGICRPDGTLKVEMLEEILLSGIDPDRLVFEAPVKDLQSYLIQRLGPNVNLGNVAPSDLIPLETLRLGLRSDTFGHFEQQRQVLSA
jgi:phosphosulfolactate synthase